jgi:hypothetical protein
VTVGGDSISWLTSVIALLSTTGDVELEGDAPDELVAVLAGVGERLSRATR